MSEMQSAPRARTQHLMARLPDNYAPPIFEGAEFVGAVDNIRRLRNGGGIMTVVIDPAGMDDALQCWHSDTLCSFNVKPWEPYPDE